MWCSHGVDMVWFETEHVGTVKCRAHELLKLWALQIRNVNNCVFRTLFSQQQNNDLQWVMWLVSGGFPALMYLTVLPVSGWEFISEHISVTSVHEHGISVGRGKRRFGWQTGAAHSFIIPNSLTPVQKLWQTTNTTVSNWFMWVRTSHLCLALLQARQLHTIVATSRHTSYSFGSGL